MVIKKELIKREIAGDTILVPVGSGVYDSNGLFALNELASFIWDLLPEADAEEDILKAILEEYEVSREQAQKDLREFLDAETLAKVSDRLYYADYAIIEQINAPVGEQVEPSVLAYPKDPKDPSTMQKPVPVGIDVSDRKDFQNSYYLPDKTVYLGVVSNTIRPELAHKFVEYLFK